MAMTVTQIRAAGFETWMQHVNAHLVRLCTMTADDLPDWGYRDAYDDGIRPAQAAMRAYRAAREDMGL